VFRVSLVSDENLKMLKISEDLYKRVFSRVLVLSLCVFNVPEYPEDFLILYIYLI
jgi:hypothetical protein